VPGTGRTRPSVRSRGVGPKIRPGRADHPAVAVHEDDPRSTARPAPRRRRVVVAPVLVAVALAAVAAVLVGRPALGEASGGARATAGVRATGPLELTAARSRKVKLPRLRRARRAAAAAVPLVFGIYPGGAAGTVGPSGRTIPEDPVRRLAALQQLRAGARPFVLHLYDAFTSRADAAGLPAWLAADVAAYTAAGFRIELVLTYRPADPAGDVDGFVDFTRARVRQLGPNRAVTDLQVTNEVNVTAAPDAADGAYAGARDALVRGVIAAKDEARRGGFGQLEVGFNWAYQTGPAEQAFFASLRAKGGAALASAVDWVGIDAYPGTWGPRLAAGGLEASVRSATVAAMRSLRTDLLPRAGLGRADIHFSESGYPTGAGRTEQMQQTVMRAAIGAIADAAAAYGVTDYRWFDLRDADSAAPSFESRYGITRDDYSPKPAFATYRGLIATLG
jgi:hypothetical protein